MPISLEEEKIAEQLGPQKGNLFRLSRGYIRKAISDLYQLPALEIPLKALPGKPPLLDDGFGCISMSHCKDGLLIGWSSNKIGIDIERKDRAFNAQRLSRKYLAQQERSSISQLHLSEQKNSILKMWLIKEAAIKWQRGKISSDLRYWRCNDTKSKAYHILNKNIIHTSIIDYEKWYIAIATDSAKTNWKPILCIE